MTIFWLMLLLFVEDASIVRPQMRPSSRRCSCSKRGKLYLMVWDDAAPLTRNNEACDINHRYDRL